MTEEQQAVLSLSLAIVSGRAKKFTDYEYRLLGFDPHKFASYGLPTDADVKTVAEEVIYDMLSSLYETAYEGA